MSITDFLREDYFEPEIMEAMRAAYRLACGAPQLENAAEATAEMLAEKIVEPARPGQANRRGPIGERALPQVLEESRRLAVEVRDDQVDRSVAIEVAGCGTHAGLVCPR